MSVLLAPGDERGTTLVELLITILITAIVASSVVGVVLSMHRTERIEMELQDVIDDGRLSLARIRKELRGARQVYQGSDEDALWFWVDQNQDSLEQPEEQVCYAVEPLPGGTAGQYHMVRWNDATSSCAPGDPTPAGASRTVLAQTLVEHPDPSICPDVCAFADYDPAPSATVWDNPTRTVTIELHLEVLGGQAVRSTLVEGTVRLRNVA